MTDVLEAFEQAPMLVHTAPVIHLDDEQFFQFCQINRDLRIERTAKGDLSILAQAGGGSSFRNAMLTRIFHEWAERDGRGSVFDSSAGFILPNKAGRSPDVSWIENTRLKELSEKQWERFLPLCPDFVLELRSPSDSLPALQLKMQEYIENGAKLGWLIDPAKKCVHIYRPDRPPEILENPTHLTGNGILNGFSLPLKGVWSVMDRFKDR